MLLQLILGTDMAGVYRPVVVRSDRLDLTKLDPCDRVKVLI
jgi:hypothetical protein